MVDRGCTVPGGKWNCLAMSWWCTRGWGLTRPVRGEASPQPGLLLVLRVLDDDVGEASVSRFDGVEGVVDAVQRVALVIED